MSAGKNARSVRPDAASARLALADASSALLNASTSAGALHAVLAALEPVRHRLERDAQLLDAAVLLVDGLWTELNAAQEAAAEACQAEGGGA